MRTVLSVALMVLLGGCINMDWGPDPYEGDDGDDLDAIVPIEGAYQCSSIEDADGARSCGEGTALELMADGSWRHGNLYDGTYQSDGTAIVFHDPDAETEAERQQLGGPASWGTAEVHEKGLVFRQDGVTTLWTPLGEADASLAGRYACVVENGDDACFSDKDLELTAAGAWTYGVDDGTYHVDGEVVRFTAEYEAQGPFGWGPAIHRDKVLTFDIDGGLTAFARIDEQANAAAPGTYACIHEGPADASGHACTDWTTPITLEADGTWTAGMYDGTWDMAGNKPVWDAKFRGFFGPAEFGPAFWNGDVLEFDLGNGDIRQFSRSGPSGQGTSTQTSTGAPAGPSAGDYACVGRYDGENYLGECEHGSTLHLEDGAWSYSYLSGEYTVEGDRLFFTGWGEGPQEWGDAYWDDAENLVYFVRDGAADAWLPSGSGSSNGSGAPSGGAGPFFCDTESYNGSTYDCWNEEILTIDREGTWEYASASGTWTYADGIYTFEGDWGPPDWGTAYWRDGTIEFDDGSVATSWFPAA